MRLMDIFFTNCPGRDEHLFVRAGNMLREPGCMSIFNQLLLRQLPSDCSFIYIDSFYNSVIRT